MSLAPLLDALDIFHAAEVIPVGGLAQPAALTLGFAGAAAIGLGTVKLVISVAVIDDKELFAATALAMIRIGAHDSDPRREEKGSDETSVPRRRREKRKKEEDFSGEDFEEDRGGRKRNFKPPEMPQFHFAVGTRAGAALWIGLAGRLDCRMS
ncbi:MAG: hypothetical protein DMG88_23250 [Acidobacteria bacterium]|nr:MAG: hypothetical protein DMG88_23250 [Acidobacteriota bacterium]